MARRLAAMADADRAAGRDPGRKKNYRRVIGPTGRWNGRIALDAAALEDPVGWRLPRVIFVNSMSDLFHDEVPTLFVQRIFEVMNRCPQHTFQVLTKRPHRTERLSECLSWTPNIWLGTSIENAAVVDRVGSLRRTGARTKFLSVEPLLGPIPRLPIDEISWVIVGGESGPGARPMRPEWVRQIRDRCAAANLPFFFKQWGGVQKKRSGRTLDGRTWDEMPLQPNEHTRNSTDGVRIAAATG